MIIGELRKILRNRVFLVMLAAVFAANLVCVLYFADAKEAYYYEAKQQEQEAYIPTYQIFLEGMEERGQDALDALDNNDSLFLRRNVEKTQRDYAGLRYEGLSHTYNVGVDEYSGYSYGIFFCLIFSFACLEYLYLFERRMGSIHILRATKNGRMPMILSKWCVYLLLVVLFTVLQELTTLFLYARIYSFGDLSAPVQSLSVFRDCPTPFTMGEALATVVWNRVFVSVALSCVIFFFGIVCSGAAAPFVIPCGIFAVQYLFSVTVSIDSSQAVLCGLNPFYVWNSRKYLGVYHNLDFFGCPVEKNDAVLAANGLILLGSVVIGSVIFAVRHQEGYRKREFILLKWLRQLLSKILHLKSIFVNELYKLLFQQKKWILLAVFLFVFVGSANSYIPSPMYQTAEEAYYHLYLSNLEGPVNDASEQYISEEKAYIETLQENIQKAYEAGDEGSVLVLSMELQSRQQAYDRLTAQYERLTSKPGVKAYWIDEMHLSKTLRKFDRDLMLFMVSAVSLILLVSGLFASDKENKISRLIHATRNGRERLFRAKLLCSIALMLLLFAGSQLPGWIGYSHVLPTECLGQRLDLLLEPMIDSRMTLLGLLALIYALKLAVYAAILPLTMWMARRTKNEFITSVFLCTVLLIVCLVMYFLKTNLSWLVISIL